MRKTLTLVVLSIMASCGGTSVPVTVQSAGDAPGAELSSASVVIPAAVDNGPDASFSLLLNDVRGDNNVAAVTYNAQLNAAAQSHAEDMLANDYFSHTGLNGSNAGDRATLAGYDWRTYGENIAAGYSSEDSVMMGWTNSAGHHRNNINPNFKEFGLGFAQDGSDTRWVLVLGAR